MSKKLIGAKIKSTVGDFEVNIPMPSGKPLLLKWTKKNDYTVQVPTQVMFRDDFGKPRVAVENLVKHLLTAGLKIQEGKVVGGERVFPHLEMVEEVYQDDIPEGLGLPVELAKPSEKPNTQKEKKNEKAV